MQPEFARAALLGATLAAFAPAAWAYVGPGAGLGMIASLFAVVIAVLATLVGLVMWPIRRFRQRRNAGADAAARSSAAPAPPSHPRS